MKGERTSMAQAGDSANTGLTALKCGRRRILLHRAQTKTRSWCERALLTLAVVALVLGFLASASSAAAAPAVRGTASDPSLVADIRAGWPQAADLYLPSNLPEGWRFSQANDPRFWPDQDYENPGFYYVPMGFPESVCAYRVAYTNGDEAIEVSAGYWPASGGSRYFHELAENSAPVDIYLGSDQWKTFTYADPPYDPGREVLFVEWDDSREEEVCYVEIDYRDADSQAAAEAIAEAIVQVARLSPFSDVSDDREDIIVLAREGIVQGYDDDTFRPDNPVLRAQLAKMLVGALGLTVTNGAIPCTFADVPLGPASDPLYPDDFVAVAAAQGIVNGFDAKTFRPYQPVTRIQMVSMVVRALKELRPGRLVEPATTWRSDYVEAGDPIHGGNVRWAQYNGLLSHWVPWSPGIPESLDDSLWQPATRGEMAAMLYEALGGELVSLHPEEGTSKSLAAAGAQLLAEVDADTPVYLPSVLPPGWAIAQVSPLDPYDGWPGYSVTFTDGHSSIGLVYPLMGDASLAFSGFFPTGLVFQGEEVELGYDLGVLYCHVYHGSLMLISPPWEREAVLAVASTMQRLR